MKSFNEAMNEAARAWQNEGCISGQQIIENVRTRWALVDFIAGCLWANAYLDEQHKQAEECAKGSADLVQMQREKIYLLTQDRDSWRISVGIAQDAANKQIKELLEENLGLSRRAEDKEKLEQALAVANEALKDLGNSYVELYPNQLESRTSLAIAKIKKIMGTEETDPTLHCTWCGAKEAKHCKCPGRAEND